MVTPDSILQYSFFAENFLVNLHPGGKIQAS